MLLKQLLAEVPHAGCDYSDSPDADPRLRPYAMTAARRQTAGRGQRGNHWESEDFKNLCFSMPAYPDKVPPACQFAISEAVALAVVALLQNHGIMASVKWPNDIYVNDSKICGILIDHALYGSSIRHTVISAGLNINQTRFLSDAPNPVSMKNILRPAAKAAADSLASEADPDTNEDLNAGIPADDISSDLDIEAIARELQLLIRTFMESAASASGRETLHHAFMQNLYRNDGQMHRYSDNIKGEEIQAEIIDVSPAGMLTLRLPDAMTRTYAFKEISFLPD